MGLASICHRLGVGMSADAANTSVCATASNAGCRISAWRTHSCVPRPHSCGRLCPKCDEKSRLTPDKRTRSASDAPRGARALRVASMIAFIAALLGPGNWECRGQTPTERSARPLGFTPGSGPIEGDRLVLIDVDEPA